MIGLYLTQPTSCSSFSFKPPLTPSSISKLKLLHYLSKTHRKKKIKRGICRAEFSPDAPLAAAIGACMLSSLLLPLADTRDEDGGDSVIDAGDTRFAAMGIISFIPYFNWLLGFLLGLIRGSAATPCIQLYTWLLTSGQICLFPPEDSWLPIASIIFCIVHVQLEASIKNGDLQGFQIFSEAAKHLSSRSSEEDAHFKGHQEPEVRKREYRNLPDAEEQSRNEIRQWGIPRNPAKHHEQSNGDWDDDGSEH